MYNTTKLLLLSIICLNFISCSNSVEEVSKIEKITEVAPPIANAGNKQIVPKRSIVMLDGSNSTSTNGPLSYKWNQIAGIPVILSSDNRSNVNFPAPSKADTLRFQLVVEDKDGRSSTESLVDISVANHSPVADAGGDRTIPFGEEIILDASTSYDLDSDILIYKWIYMGLNPDIILTNPTDKVITLPATTKYGEVLSFKLAVTDEENISSEIDIILTVVSQQPFANAGMDQIGVAQESTISLNGLKSVDLEQAQLSYTWKQIHGPTVTLNDPSSPTPTFLVPNKLNEEVYEFELIVNDGETDSVADVVTVSALHYAGQSVRLAQNPFLPNIAIPNPSNTANYKIKIVNNIAYAVDYNSGLWIIDISDPNNTKLLDNYKVVDKSPLSISINGNYAYITNSTSLSSGGIDIVDISDPASPKFSNSNPTNGFEFFLDGNTGVLDTRFNGVVFFDVSNPASIVKTGSYSSTTQPPEMINAVEISNGLVYIAYPSRIEIISILPPNSPEFPALVGTYTTPQDETRDIVVLDGYLYSIFPSDGLHIINVSDPTSPTIASKHPLNSSFTPCGLQVAAGVTYISGLYGGLATVDVSNPINPQGVSFYNNTFACEFANSSDHLVLGQNNGVVMLNIGKVFDETAMNLRNVANILNIDISNNYLIATDGNNVFNFDITNPTQFIDSGILSSATAPTKLQYAHPYAYVLNITPNVKLEIYDTSIDPFQLQGSHDLTGDTYIYSSYVDLKLDGSRPIIANHISGLNVMNISNSVPLQIGSYTATTFVPNKVAIFDNYALTGYNNMVHLLDIKDINNPVFVTKEYTSTSLSGKVIDMEASNGYFYVANDHQSSVDVFTVSNNRLLKIAILPDVGIGYIGDIDIIDNELFLTRTNPNGSGSGLYLYDITNHAAPALKGRLMYGTKGITSIATNQNTVYVADKNNGIYAVPIGVNLNPLFGTTDVKLGATLSYNFNWPVLSNVYDIACQTSAGSCVISNTDPINRTATVNWTLPSTGGSKNYGMYVAIGNSFYFLSSEEILFVP